MRASQVNTRADLRSSEPSVGVVLGLAGYRDGVPGYATAITVAIDSLNPLGSGSRILGVTSDLIQDVAKTSHNAAIKFIENKYSSSKADSLKNRQFLIHVAPLYEIKDGPSIGLAILSAFISFALGQPPKPGIAVTGEVDFNGNISPIGLIDSKLKGAEIAGVQQVIIPEKSDDIPDNIRQQLPDSPYNFRRHSPSTAIYRPNSSSNPIKVILVNKYDDVHNILFEDTT